MSKDSLMDLNICDINPRKAERDDSLYQKRVAKYAIKQGKQKTREWLRRFTEPAPLRVVPDNIAKRAGRIDPTRSPLD
jgi:hypothetical protein